MPRSLNTACLQVAQELGINLSGDTLKRALHAAGYTWKCIRRSLRTLRDKKQFCAEQKFLRKLCKESAISTILAQSPTSEPNAVSASSIAKQ